jgi:hypothetical protein
MPKKSEKEFELEASFRRSFASRIAGSSPPFSFSTRKKIRFQKHCLRIYSRATTLVTQRESPTNEPYRYKLRLRHGGFRAGVTVALSCL